MMEAQAKSYTITIEDLGDFDLDEDRSIAPSIEFALKQGGVADAVVDQNEFNSSMVEVVTTATQDELERALQRDDLHAEVSMNEDNEEMVHSPAGQFKQDDFTSGVKAQKKFKYVPAKHGDNPLTNEEEAVTEDRFKALMSEYKSFVAESDSKKKTK